MSRNKWSLLLVGVLCFAFFQCGSDHNIMIGEPQGPAKDTLNLVLLYDISESSDHLTTYINEIESLIEYYAQTNVIKVVAIRIDDNGDRQRPYHSGYLNGDTVLVRGDYVEKSNAKKRNKSIQEAYDLQLAETLDSITSYVLLEQVSPQTDVNGALHLLKTVCREIPTTQNIEVVIISDMIHDLGKEETPVSVELTSNAAVFVVGLSREIDLTKVFPENKAYERSNIRALISK